MKWLCFLFLCLFARKSAACEINLALDTAFEPFIILASEQPDGMNIQMLKLLLNEVGCSLKYSKSPWARSLKLLRSGEIDVVSQLSFTTERQKDYFFVGPHYVEHLLLITNPEATPPVRDFADFVRWPNSIKVAYLNGAFLGVQLQQMKKDPRYNNRFYPLLSNEDKIALLDTGRVHAVLEEQLAWWWRIKRRTSIFKPVWRVNSNAVYFGFSRASIPIALQRKLVTAWQHLYDSGQLENIRNQYAEQLKTIDTHFVNGQAVDLLPPLPRPDPHR